MLPRSARRAGLVRVGAEEVRDLLFAVLVEQGRLGTEKRPGVALPRRQTDVVLRPVGVTDLKGSVPCVHLQVRGNGRRSDHLGARHARRRDRESGGKRGRQYTEWLHAVLLRPENRNW